MKNSIIIERERDIFYVYNNCGEVIIHRLDDFNFNLYTLREMGYKVYLGYSCNNRLIRLV